MKIPFLWEGSNEIDDAVGHAAKQDIAAQAPKDIHICQLEAAHADLF